MAVRIEYEGQYRASCNLCRFMGGGEPRVRTPKCVNSHSAFTSLYIYISKIRRQELKEWANHKRVETLFILLLEFTRPNYYLVSRSILVVVVV